MINTIHYIFISHNIKFLWSYLKDIVKMKNYQVQLQLDHYKTMINKLQLYHCTPNCIVNTIKLPYYRKITINTHLISQNQFFILSSISFIHTNIKYPSLKRTMYHNPPKYIPKKTTQISLLIGPNSQSANRFNPHYIFQRIIHWMIFIHFIFWTTSILQ